LAPRDTASRIGPIAQRLVENQYAQENLRAGVDSLQAAYRRASKRRVRPDEDRKVREQVRQGAASIAEAARALKSDRRKRKKQRGKVVLVIVGVAGAGAAAAIATSEELRSKLFGQASEDDAARSIPEVAH